MSTNDIVTINVLVVSMFSILNVATAAASETFARQPLSTKFPQAEVVHRLIKGFLLLQNLLEWDSPWGKNLSQLGDHIFPCPTELGIGSEEPPLYSLTGGNIPCTARMRFTEPVTL